MRPHVHTVELYIVMIFYRIRVACIISVTCGSVLLSTALARSPLMPNTHRRRRRDVGGVNRALVFIFMFLISAVHGGEKGRRDGKR